MSEDLYKILGLKKDATPEEIKSAQREMAKTNHPDKGGSDEAMALINKAYRTLSNPESRIRYDLTGQSGEKNFEARFNGYAAHVFITIIEKCENVDTQDIVVIFRENINIALDNIQKDITTTQDLLSRHKKAKSRLKSNDNSFLLNIINNKIEEQEKQLKFYEEEINFYQYCREKSNEYSYQTDSVISFGFTINSIQA